ncbi:MAG: iron-sulfur cluster assembly accessory protein [Myxococcota bacterium]
MIEMTDRAAERIREVTHGHEAGYQGLRVGLQDGGCSGYAYQLEFEATPEDDDLVFEHAGAKVFVHPLHLPFLQGSVLTWNDSALVSGFTLENPNVKRVCGCGESFDV